MSPLDLDFSCKQVEKPPPASELPGMDAEQERESRKSISNAVAIPQFLKDRFPMPPDIQVVHVQHRTKTLPHFQAKLPTGQLFEHKQPGSISRIPFFFGKAFMNAGHFVDGLTDVPFFRIPNQFSQLRASTSASYNPSLPPDQVNENFTTIAMQPAKSRSQAQAFFMVYKWVLNAKRHSQKRKRE